MPFSMWSNHFFCYLNRVTNWNVYSMGNIFHRIHEKIRQLSFVAESKYCSAARCEWSHHIEHSNFLSCHQMLRTKCFLVRVQFFWRNDISGQMLEYCSPIHSINWLHVSWLRSHPHSSSFEKSLSCQSLFELSFFLFCCFQVDNSFSGDNKSFCSLWPACVCVFVPESRCILKYAKRN